MLHESKYFQVYNIGFEECVCERARERYREARGWVGLVGHHVHDAWGYNNLVLSTAFLLFMYSLMSFSLFNLF